MSKKGEKTIDRQKYLLDTSAIITLSKDEPGSNIVFDILQKAKKGNVDVYVSFMSVMEACYKIHQYEDEESSHKMFNYIQHLPIKRIDVNDNLILSASFIKAGYSVSMPDAWIIATAKYIGAHLVHKDPEFEQLKEVIHQIILPYKDKLI